ncbi:MAG TPA: hypothetical protein VMH04_03655 [Candidatus Solibacter sp.]|nr:hypothetical protein [Candidatus Solibacter sp.]
MPCPQNPAAVSIVNGSILNGGTLQKGCPFYWANPTYEAVTLSGCDGFCTASSYQLSGRPAGLNYSITEATLLANPTNWNFSESPNKWNAPGMPHIQTPPWPSPVNEEKPVDEVKEDKEVA